MSNDRGLVAEGVMAMLGKFTAFSILNTRVAICGLSRLCVKIITSTWWPKAEDVKVEDVHDPDAKIAAEKVTFCNFSPEPWCP